jgi:hypothetical protein
MDNKEVLIQSIVEMTAEDLTFERFEVRSFVNVA